MDEATASIDYETEKLIQEALKDLIISRTVITIVHRIKTIINYDKILVLDNGRLVEFDKPEVLRRSENSIFVNLCESSRL